MKRIISSRRDHLKQNVTSSGICEIYGKKETFLDDLILEMDEKDERERTEKHERTDKGQRLLRAGEEIRTLPFQRTAIFPEQNSALGAASCSSASDDIEEGGCGGSWQQTQIEI